MVSLAQFARYYGLIAQDVCYRIHSVLSCMIRLSETSRFLAPYSNLRLFFLAQFTVLVLPRSALGLHEVSNLREFCIVRVNFQSILTRPFGKDHRPPLPFS